MKTILLFAASLLTAGAALAVNPAAGFSGCWDGMVEKAAPQGNDTRASGSLYFTYAKQAATAYNLQNVTAEKTRVYIAVKMRDDELKLFRGNRITAVGMVNGTTGQTGLNPTPEAEVFVTTDLNKEPEVKQTAKLASAAFQQNTVILDKPFEISDDVSSLYFGYSFVLPASSAQSYYVAVDKVLGEPTNLIYGMSDTSDLPEQWGESGHQIGAACAGITISGDNMPGDKASIGNCVFPRYVKLGTKGSYDLEIFNDGANPVQTVEVTTTVEGQEPVTKVVNLGTALQPNGIASFTVTGVPFDNAGFINITSQLTKVNGVPQTNPSDATGVIPVFDEGFDRNLVVEEGTGTWCGWCPAGIVMLEYIAELYGDRYFGIACHYDDRMAVTDYVNFIKATITGFPGTITNRVDYFTPSTMNGSIVLERYVNSVYAEYTAYPSYVGVSASVVPDLDNKTCQIDATAEFALDSNNGYAFNFVIIENNVGPFNQGNYYAGGTRGEMAGWETKGSQVSTIYNDVARAYKTYGGINGSIPAQVKAGEKYNYNTSISLANCSTGKLENMFLIAFVTDKKSGEILNACKVCLAPNAVGSIEAEDNGEARYYNLQGVEVKNPEKGFYIKVQNGKSTKELF